MLDDRMAQSCGGGDSKLRRRLDELVSAEARDGASSPAVTMPGEPLAPSRTPLVPLVACALVVLLVGGLLVDPRLLIGLVVGVLVLECVQEEAPGGTGGAVSNHV